MPIYRLGRAVTFPAPARADRSGLLAVGGDLSPERLLEAYRVGVFPWYNDPGGPILWWSPNPRLIVEAANLHVSRSLAKRIRQHAFTVRFDTAFAEVIGRCAATPRRDQDGTWITPEMRDAYITLHQLGYAHSAESWAGSDLVGGVYGIHLGGCFFGESMFSTQTDASKVAFVALVRRLEGLGTTLLDAQVSSAHLLTLGARAIPRADFLDRLAELTQRPTLRGRWVS